MATTDADTADEIFRRIWSIVSPLHHFLHINFDKLHHSFPFVLINHNVLQSAFLSVGLVHMSVDVVELVSTIIAISTGMRKKHHGHIITVVATYLGLPNMQDKRIKKNPRGKKPIISMMVCHYSH